MWSREMEYFYFSIFQNQSKLFKKRRNNIIAIKEIQIWNNQRFVLSNKKSIINKRIEMGFLDFLIIFQKYKELERDIAQKE